MNTEIQIIQRRPFSFVATVIGQGLTPVATGLAAMAAMQPEKIEDLSARVVWLCMASMALGGVVSACQAVRAWFSTSAARAREEITAAENGNGEPK